MAGLQCNSPHVAGKLRLIDAAHRAGARTFADMGGTGVVNGGYSIYSLQNGFKSGVMVDRRMPSATRINCSGHAVELQECMFADAKIEHVGVVFLFYVLLHQLPVWDRVLAQLAQNTKRFAVFNPQYTGDATVRLMDLEDYFDHVPYGPEREDARDRDSINPWQWGITDSDLWVAMQSLGFALRYYEDCGPYPNPDVKNIRNRAFLFEKP